SGWRGRWRRLAQFSDECHLRETMEENHYNTYSSALHRKVYLGLSHQGRVKKGTRVNPRLPSAHFLPRRQS
uniref:FGF n=1 Tax=Neogobius melanostomus TaxID=47308 RepID=A0A8C6WYM6_9GOBI